MEFCSRVEGRCGGDFAGNDGCFRGWMGISVRGCFELKMRYMDLILT